MPKQPLHYTPKEMWFVKKERNFCLSKAWFTDSQRCSLISIGNLLLSRFHCFPENVNLVVTKFGSRHVRYQHREADGQG